MFFFPQGTLVFNLGGSGFGDGVGFGAIGARFSRATSLAIGNAAARQFEDVLDRLSVVSNGGVGSGLSRVGGGVSCEAAKTSSCAARPAIDCSAVS